MNHQWLLPKNVIPLSLSIMAPHGRRGNEGLALWLGKDVEQGVQVTHVVELVGSGFETSPLRLSISLSGMAALTELAEKHDTYLVGQIHSHPERYIDLSWVDKAYGIRVPDYLSLVCPFYAQRRDTSLADCRAHVFEGAGYRRMSSEEAADRLRSVPNDAAHLVLEVIQ